MNELTVERYQSKRKKPGPTARRIAKRRRAEQPVAKAVRAACVERDGYCRICNWEQNPDDWHSDYLDPTPDPAFEVNPSEWAHMGEKKRAKTRGMTPEQRHATAGSLMLCRVHHDRYDGRSEPRIYISEFGSHGLGADGPLEMSQ